MNRPTGFADGRQHSLEFSPADGALVQRTHQQTVRCADEIYVAGLALAVAHLAIAEPQLLLAVEVKRLGAYAVVSVHQHHTNHLPHQPIIHQGFVASASSRSLQNSTIRTGYVTSAIRIRLRKYQYLRLPRRTGFLACQGICPATS